MAQLNYKCQLFEDFYCCFSFCKKNHNHLYLTRQEALLAAISEKDANIALLELSASKKKKTQEEVMALKREKDRLVHQLKQQVGRPARKVCLAGSGASVLSLGFAILHSPMPILQLKQLQPGRSRTACTVARTPRYRFSVDVHVAGLVWPASGIAFLSFVFASSSRSSSQLSPFQ